MSFGVKKLIFYGILLVFIAFSLSACFESIENTGESSYTNVEYSADGKSLTLYIDGSAPVRTDRSLTQRLALLAHDYFEVTFLYNADGTAANYTIARAAWELGEPAGISDVYRTEGGIDYYGTNPVGIPANTQGSVVLFVGKKSDKTLLAVGTLSHIDDVSITNATKPLITSNTRKVRFEVNALQAGVNRTVNSSSFRITGINTPPPPTPLGGPNRRL